jgi:hypothetical protein
MKNLTPILRWGLVGLALIFNVLWYFVPLAGSTGASSIYEVHHALVVVAAIPAAFLIGLTVMAIKKW